VAPVVIAAELADTETPLTLQIGVVLVELLSEPQATCSASESSAIPDGARITPSASGRRIQRVAASPLNGIQRCS
jgi:hypothetical protein